MSTIYNGLVWLDQKCDDDGATVFQCRGCSKWHEEWELNEKGLCEDCAKEDKEKELKGEIDGI